jgi:hypothetical protein
VNGQNIGEAARKFKIIVNTADKVFTRAKQDLYVKKN